MIEPLYRRADDIDPTTGFIISQHRFDAIFEFLCRVEELAPEVTDDLCPIVPLAIEAFNKERELDLPLGQTFSWQGLIKLKEPEFVRLREALEDWAKKYHLADNYGLYMHTALQAICNILPCDKRSPITMEETQKILETCSGADIVLSDAINLADDEDDRRLTAALGQRIPFFEPGHYMPFSFSPDTLLFLSGDGLDDALAYEAPAYENPRAWLNSANPIGWDPRYETWKEFETKMDALYERYKAAYKKRTEEFFKQNGYEAGGEKRTDEHFEWFVRYQVQGWSKERIAGEHHTTRQNVSNAIEDTARLVCLEPRPTAKGGRPKKG